MLDGHIAEAVFTKISKHTPLSIVPLQFAIMNIDITEDLKLFKSELIAELKEILQTQQPVAKTWLRSSEVRKLLSISPGTLQNLRVNGTLRFQKIGGTMFYKSDDINQMLGEKPSKGDRL